MEPKQQAPYPLRMPPEMRSHYEDLADAAKRSLNAEIVAGLQELQGLRDRVESLRYEVGELRSNYHRAQERLVQAAGEIKRLQARESEAAVLTKQYELMSRGLAQFLVTLASVSRPMSGMEGLHEHFAEAGRTLVDSSANDDGLRDPVAEFLGLTEGLREEIDRARRVAAETLAAREKGKAAAGAADSLGPVDVPQALQGDLKVGKVIRRTQKTKP